MILVEIAGYLGDDPEERFTPSGKRVVSLRVATRVKRDETVWWRVNIWGDRFDRMLPYLKKGSGVIIIGEMEKPDTYVSKKDGSTQVSLTLNAEIVKFSPFGRSDRSGEQSSQQSSQTFQTSGEPSYSGKQEEFAGSGANLGQESDFTGDDLPF